MTDENIISETQLNTARATLHSIFIAKLAISVVAGAALCGIGILVFYVLAANFDSSSIIPPMLLAGLTCTGAMAFADWKTHRAEIRAIEELRQRIIRGGTVYATDLISSPQQTAERDRAKRGA